jgi:hypothetical protein
VGCPLRACGIVRATLALYVAAFALAPIVSCAGSGGEGHDAIPESRDVQVRGAQAPGGESLPGYDYVARRPLAVVALAEARGLDPQVAHSAVDRLADALDACATEEGRKGSLARGAARVVAQIEANGTVGGTNLRIDPGAGVASNAVVCLVAPLRMLGFPPTDASARGIAVEALWGTLIPSK